jgi:hypothetical protein
VSSTVSLCAEPAAQRVALDVVRERGLAVDLDNGEPLPIPRLQVGVAADVHLAQLEWNLLADGEQVGPRPLAQMAALRVVERDARGYG